MYAVCVTFELKSGQADAFLRLMYQNARTSLREEPGCVRFDVLTDADKPDAVFLYEIYTDRAAFDMHLGSDHFSKFDSAATPMIAEKNIQTWGHVIQ